MRIFDHAEPAGTARRCQIGVSSLAPGMYVADLDRPWADTPFLLEGFLVDSGIELETLRRYCRYVYVDPDRSNPELAQAIHHAERFLDPVAAGAELAPSSPDRTDRRSGVGGDEDRPANGASRATRGSRLLRARSDLRISNQTRERFRRFVRATVVTTDGPTQADGMILRATGWVRGLLAAGDDEDSPRAWQQRSRQAVRAMLPPGTTLSSYAGPIAFDEALPRAQVAVRGTRQALAGLLGQVRDNERPDLGPVVASVDELVAVMTDNPDAPSWVARVQNGGHDGSVRAISHALAVAIGLIALGRSIGLPRDGLASLGLIGLLADVGMTRLPHALLEKPGMLSPAEHALVKEHVRLGLDALRRSARLPDEIAQGIAQHHERLDGSGYPKGLRGSGIGVWGRMAAVVDCFVALISPRPYAATSNSQDALMSLYEWTGGSFDEVIVEQFVQAIGIFPVGSLVELASGEIAAVMSLNLQRRLEPRVLILTDAQRRPLGQPFEFELPIVERRARERRAHAPDARIVRGLPAGTLELPAGLVGPNVGVRRVDAQVATN